jgi:alpha-glucoside transport system substrate-binding protein
MTRFARGVTLSMAALLSAGVVGSGAVTAQSPAVPLTGQSISVTSLWGGSEQESFQKVLDAFTAKTGIAVSYESIRDDYATVLQTRLTGGNPPDVSILPGIGFLRRFAKDGSIKKISELGLDPVAIEANYPPGTLEVGKVAGDLYALMVKFNSKSTMWYRPDRFTALGVTPPADWDAFVKALNAIKTGGDGVQGLGAKDDWTLTDWFENIYIRQAGPDKYDQLFSGKLPWTDPSVTDAITAMKSVLNNDLVAGGIDAALGRGFVDGIGQVFSANPEADVYYEGGFVGGIATGQVNTALEPGKTIDWFPFPSINGGDGVTIGGDVIAALTTNPGVKEFVEYMSTPESGDVWAATGAIISPVLGVDPGVYPNDLVKKEAAQVAGASAVRFDGSDLLPASAPNLGALLQSAIRGDDVAPLLTSFEEQVQAAWASE